MSDLSKLNELWHKLSENERIEFINSKIEYSKNVKVSLESITGSESLKMDFGQLTACPKCGR